MYKHSSSFYLLFTILTLISNPINASEENGHIRIYQKAMLAYRQGNLMTTMALLEQAVQKNYAPAQNTLAYILDQAEENKRAFQLYQRAADQNYPDALFGLGNMYAKGEGTQQDSNKAGLLIRQSAKLKHPPAMRAYAYALEFGQLGFSQDLEQAFHWYQLCSSANDPVCKRRVIQVYTHGGLNQTANLKKAQLYK